MAAPVTQARLEKFSNPGAMLCVLDGGDSLMTEDEKEALLRQYAAGDIGWTSLRGRGFPNYRDVLAGLGRLGLRPPVAPMEGPNVEARMRARAILREALADTAPR